MRQRSRAALLTAWLLTGLGGPPLAPGVSAQAAAGDASPEARPLEPGPRLEGSLTGDEVHRYQVDLAAGEIARVELAQHSVLLVVSWFDPAGQRVVETDLWTGDREGVGLAVIAETAGTYEIEVRRSTKGPASGRYAISLQPPRTATEDDRAALADERAMIEVNRLYDEGTEPGLRRSIELLEQIADYARSTDRPAREANALYGVGTIYQELGEYPEAQASLERSLEVARRAGDRFQEGKSLARIARIQYLLGEPEAAETTAREVLEIGRREGHLELVGEVLNGLAAMRSSQGKYQQALDALRQALEIWRQVGTKSYEFEALHNLGAILRYIGDSRQAIDLLERALEFFRAENQRFGEASALSHLAHCHFDLGEVHQGLGLLTQALALRREVGDRYGEAATLQKIGLGHSLAGDWEQAGERFAAALEIQRSLGDREGRASSLNQLAGASLALGRTEEALDVYRRALGLWRRLGYRRGEAEARFGLARCERQRGRHGEALEHVEAALDIVESLRIAPADPKLRSFFFASTQDLFELRIDLLMDLHRADPAAGYAERAFEVSERARARSLLDLLAESGMDLRQGVDPGLLARERSLEKEIRRAQADHLRQQAEAAEAEQVPEIPPQLARLLDELGEVRARIRSQSPRYAALASPRPAALSDVRREIADRGTLLLQYFLGAEGSFLWAVTAQDFEVHELPAKAEIEAGARRYYELLTTSHHRSDQRSAELAGIAISRILLGPVAARLSRAHRLVVASDGALRYLPFAALPDPSTLDKATPRPLVVRHEVIHLPSVSALASLRQKTAGRRPASKAVAVLADPVFRASDPRVRRDTADSAPPAGEPEPAPAATQGVDVERFLAAAGVPRLERLVFSRREAETIAALAPPEQVLQALDFSASQEMVLGGELADYRVLHIATHGFLNSERPELSGLVLSLVDEQGRQRDGLLALHQIYDLDLPVELVVLSACRTALGQDVRGEGLASLARGFLHAGARAVVVSLWNVSDASTAELMERFYRRMLTAGERPAAALRAAQASMWQQERWRAPYYWAGFVLQGDWR